MSTTEPHSDVFKKARREAVFRGVFRGAVVALLAAVLFLAGNILGHVDTVVTSIRHEQVQNTARSKQTNEAAVSSQQVLAILKDCLTPGGKCYARSQQNTAKILDDVTQIDEFIATCSLEPSITHSTVALEECVSVLEKEHGIG